jgi:hypothetical protein
MIENWKAGIDPYLEGMKSGSIKADMLRKAGWRVHEVSGRWWREDFQPAQNTLTFDQAWEFEHKKTPGN